MKKDFDFDDIGKRTPYTTPRRILRGCATKGNGTYRGETTAEVSHEADYFYGSCHSGSINWNFIRSVLASNG